MIIKKYFSIFIDGDHIQIKLNKILNVLKFSSPLWACFLMLVENLFLCLRMKNNYLVFHKNKVF